MTIPTQNQCFQMLHDSAMPEHIVAHSLQVCRVARLLTGALIQRGAALDMDLVTASALLHDITKPRSFETGENHCETGAALLAEKGYGRVGKIVGQHVRLDAYAPGGEPTEAGIVNYADKRVLHDQVASLDRRMAYILERYGKAPDSDRRIRWLWDVSAELERRIYRDLSFAPADLDGQIGDVDNSPEMKAFKAVAAACPDP
ncbi:MAG: HDIG domain-containing protein [Desulfobacterales bacterium]|nr:HDIG domain-containing protein [Desulfobacterales bacterium]